MHQAHRALFRAADRTLMMRFGITTAQHGVLLYLAERDGATMGEIAGAIGLKSAATSGLIDRMEKKRLVDRQPSALDGRSYIVYLRPYGREIVAASKELLAEANAQLLAGFSGDQLKQFADILVTLKQRADAFDHTLELADLDNTSIKEA